MKKYFILALATLFAGSAMALENVPRSGMTWIGFGGMTVSNLKGETLNSKVGVTFGAKMEYMLPNAYGTYISAGIDWTHKGARWTGPVTFSDGSIENLTQKFQSHYLELPIHFGYRYNFSKKFGIYGEVGPYFAFGVTGKFKYKPDSDLRPDESEMVFGKNVERFFPTYARTGMNNKNNAIQRFDCGLGFRVGAEFKDTYSINVGYDWGFTDMYTDKFRTAYQQSTIVPGTLPTGIKLPKLKNHNLAITIGYRF